MTDIEDMDLKDLLFAHRVASIEWHKAHADAFPVYFYAATDPTDEQQARLDAAMDRNAEIEQAIWRKVTWND